MEDCRVVTSPSLFAFATHSRSDPLGVCFIPQNVSGVVSLPSRSAARLLTILIEGRPREEISD
jgi:hypothetical protein